MTQPLIDHVLVNVDDQLDSAAEVWRALGFSLTDRGHHSIGSSNHLAIFGDDYFELLGYEPQNSERAAGQWGAIRGLAGVIFKTNDAEALADRLHGAGIATLTERPMPLSRPVELPDGTAPLARFETLHVDPKLTPSGRIFFCQHLTPELVWRPEWQSHANGVDGITSGSFSSTDPAATAAKLVQITGAAPAEAIPGGLRLKAGKAVVDVLTPEAAREAFGADIPAAAPGAERKVALGFRTSSLEKARAALSAGGIAFTTRGDGKLLVPASAASGVALTFEEAAA